MQLKLLTKRILSHRSLTSSYR